MKRKANGIKGITVAQKSNDQLRDKVLETLRSSGIKGTIESRIVFAHTAIYVNESLFGWVGSGDVFSIRCNNSTQKKICNSFGCEVMKSDNHKDGNYYLISTSIQSNANRLRALAEEFIEAAPPPKTAKAKKRKA